MTTANKIRTIRKLFRKIAHELNECYEMDMDMGCGECGREISEHYHNSMNTAIENSLVKIGMTREEYKTELKKIMLIESVHLVRKPWNDTPLAYNDFCILSF